MKAKSHPELGESLGKISEEQDAGIDSLLLNKYPSPETNEFLWDDKNMGEKDAVYFKIKKGIEYGIQQNYKLKKRRIITATASIAASIILFIGLFVLLNPFENRSSLLTAQTFSVADSVILSDRTIVYLSPNSTFLYPQKFNKKERNVFLTKGNAFFKVARNPEKPFIITSGSVRTRVLGTSFSIHLNKDSYYVVVHTGKVNVSTDKDNVDLLPFQEALYLKNGRSLLVKNIDKDEVKPWYNSDITLTNQSIEAILKIIEQKYGVESISVNPELLQLKATVFIPENELLDSLLEQLNYITNLKFKAYDGIIKCTK